jgi:hypothetical protein
MRGMQQSIGAAVAGILHELGVFAPSYRAHPRLYRLGPAGMSAVGSLLGVKRKTFAQSEAYRL